MVDPIHLCPKCMVVRTPRSRHCSTCNSCVERYDHHCPWVNNCIGQANHGYFMVFLTSLAATLASIFVYTLMGLLRLMPEDMELAPADLKYVIFPERLHLSKDFFLISSGVLLCLLVIAGMFVSMLLLIQFKNFWSNRTTNERFSRKKVALRRPSQVTEMSERSDSTGSSLLSSITQK